MRDADGILRGVEWSGIPSFAECDRNGDFRARVDSDPNAEAAAPGMDLPPPPPRQTPHSG